MAKYTTYLEKIRAGCGLIIPLCLPFSIKLTNFFILTFFGLTLVTRGLKKNERAGRSDYTKLIISILPFLVCAATLLYAPSFSLGLRFVDKYLPLLFFPVIFFLSRESDPKIIFRIFGLFILLFCVVSASNALFNFFIIGKDIPIVGDDYTGIPTKWNAFTGENLIKPFALSPIYLSTYVGFTIYIFIYCFDKSTFRTLAIIFLSAYLFLLGSRIGLGAFAASLVVFLLRKRTIKPLFIVGCIGIFGVFLFLNPILKRRYVENFIGVGFPQDVSGWNAVNIRLSIWNCSLQAFVEKPLLGYGAGGANGLRGECYRQYSWYGHFGDKHFNSHNQYIEYMLIGGLLLLAVFLVQMGYTIWVAWTSKNDLHIIFLCLLLVAWLGESMLERQWGIVFFGLFNSILLFTHSGGSQKTAPKPTGNLN